MADRMGIKEALDPEVDELKQDVVLAAVLREMEDRAQERAQQHGHERRSDASGGEE